MKALEGVTEALTIYPSRVHVVVLGGEHDGTNSEHLGTHLWTELGRLGYRPALAAGYRAMFAKIVHGYPPHVTINEQDGGAGATALLMAWYVRTLLADREAPRRVSSDNPGLSRG